MCLTAHMTISILLTQTEGSRVELQRVGVRRILSPSPVPTGNALEYRLARRGVEPRYWVLKTLILPLDDRATYNSALSMVDSLA